MDRIVYNDKGHIIMGMVEVSTSLPPSPPLPLLYPLPLPYVLLLPRSLLTFCYCFYQSIYDQSLQGYLDHGHHAIMGYSLGFTAHNFAFEPEVSFLHPYLSPSPLSFLMHSVQGELQEQQEQEVFFWNVKNYKITLIRVNSRLSVVKQLKIGQCPQTRTALCVWPQVNLKKTKDSRTKIVTSDTYFTCVGGGI